LGLFARIALSPGFLATQEQQTAKEGAREEEMRETWTGKVRMRGMNARMVLAGMRRITSISNAVCCFSPPGPPMAVPGRAYIRFGLSTVIVAMNAKLLRIPDKTETAHDLQGNKP
jgi:hypothetical protein